MIPYYDFIDNYDDEALNIYQGINAVQMPGIMLYTIAKISGDIVLKSHLIENKTYGALVSFYTERVTRGYGLHYTNGNGEGCGESYGYAITFFESGFGLKWQAGNGFGSGIGRKYSDSSYGDPNAIQNLGDGNGDMLYIRGIHKTKIMSSNTPNIKYNRSISY